MNHPLLFHARQVLEAHFNGRGWRGELHAGPLSPPRGCFVSLKIGSRLRGCIGTVLPARKYLEEEVAENTMAAAMRDPRFDPLQAEELHKIRFSIDLLSTLEPIVTQEELNPKRYGVMVRSGSRCGVLLPDLPGIDTVERQLEIALEKAGIVMDPAVKMSRFEVERLQE